MPSVIKMCGRMGEVCLVLLVSQHYFRVGLVNVFIVYYRGHIKCNYAFQLKGHQQSSLHSECVLLTKFCSQFLISA